MQLYVLNRARETLETTAGVYDDKHTLTLDAGSSTYEFTIAKTDPASQCMDTGNYIVLQDDNGKNWVFTILDYEENQYTKTVYAEDVGIELLNKNCDIWKSEGPHSFEWYFNKIVDSTPWKLGVNQLAGLERTLTYEGRDTGLGRLLSIMTAFDHAECKMGVSFTANRPCDFVVNVYKTIGADRSDVQIVYNHELDNITKKESRAQFVTALCGVGGTVTPPEGQETAEQENIDFADFEYNKDGLVTTKGDKFLRAVDANKRFNPGQTSYIESYYTYDTQSASELLNRTITQLKTYSEPQYTYTADVKVIDSTLEIGDTVTIIDHDYNPALYLSARVAKLEKSYTDPAQNTIEFCNYKLLNSQLSKLNELQNIVSKLPSASQVAKLESNVADLSSKTDELTSQITSANGKNTNYYGAVEPANPKNGDLWYKKLKSGETEMYQYQDGTWQLLASTAEMHNTQKEVDQAKSDMAQAKTDAQNAYDEAIKATNTANGAKAQTDEALKQAKQANDSYTALAKEVADNKTSVDADVADIRKAIDANKASADADWKQAQKDYASVSDKLTETSKTVTDIKTSVNGIKTTVADNTGKISTVSQTVNGVKTSVANAQGDIATIKTDVSGAKQTVANAQKDITSIKTSVSGVQTDITNAKKDITSVKTDISGVKTSVSNVQGDVTSLKTSVSGVQADVKNAKGDITSIKADVSGVKTTIANHTGKITQLTTDVSGVKSSVSSKVDKTTYQSYVAQTDKALSAKLTASDLRGYAKAADVKQTTDGLSASITKVQSNLAYQATELIGKKSFEDGNVGDWYCADLKTRATLDKGNSVSGLSNWIYPSTSNDLYYNNVYIPVKAGDVFYVEALIPNHSGINKGLNITARAYLRYNQNGAVKWQVGPAVTIAPGHWGWIKGTITVPDGVSGVMPCFSTKNNSNTTVKTYLTYASFTKLDEYTQNQLTTLSGKITATSDRLSSVYTKSEVDGKLGTKVEQSALTQASNSLSASIAKNSKILSSAGLVDDKAYINANRIALNGKVLMSNATINDAFIGNLSANKITTGTLNAAKVNLINVNASNISTGTLNGIKITSTGKDPSGTSSTTNIQSGYIDTNVINCSDYILVGKADADPRKRWQTKQTPQGMWFQTPAKITGHTGNAVSDWQTEWQGFMGGDGWNYRNTTVTGTGYSGIQLALTPQQEWGNPYGGDMMSFGTWIRTETSNKTKNILDGTLDPFLWYSYTGQSAAYKDTVVIPKPLRVFGETHFDWDIHVKGGGSHGIRTAWVSWSDWGSNQKVPCIVQDKDNWGGIAFPANGRTVLFTHDYRVNTDKLPRDGGRYNGWGS